MSVLERIRASHETVERLEVCVGKELDSKPVGQKARTWQQHRVAKLVDTIASMNRELVDLYNDKDGTFRDELQCMKKPDMFTTFYDSLKRTKEYHERFPNIITDNEMINIDKLLDDIQVPFSGEEIFGKYFDLHELHDQYSNVHSDMPGKEQEYVQYLLKFNSFFYISEAIKMGKPYSVYVKNLYDYLYGFFTRVQPLVDLETIISKEWSVKFDALWREGKVPGWKGSAMLSAAAANSSSSKNPPQALRLQMFNSSRDLEALGGERLKEALEALGLKAGGTLKDRAERLWAVRDMSPDDIPNKYRAKTVATDKAVTSSSSARDGIDEKFGSDSKQKIAWIEYKIVSICEIMSDVVIATRKHVEKQHTRTAEEKRAEREEEEFGLLPNIGDAADDEDKEDDGPLYNPLNIPLGWDGKPIPYWLYKLHGLGVEFKCEVCGNQSYWGRRNFDRHFQEWKHAHGMRCLGVPNTKHFHDITAIQDVLALYAKIKDALTTEQFVGEIHEEFEDTEGNVFNRRTYEDLARQGLL